ncbi:MAG TPA: phosphonatase-like hydrolase [Sediminibacterium sp.]|nr:phosphonatase-like hydrolase [Sediminibacterium sp.]
MSDRYKMVVFDMAGTTVDEDNLVYKTLHQSLRQAGVDCTLEEVLAHGAGKEKRKAIEDVLHQLRVALPETGIDEIYAHFLQNLTGAYQFAPIQPQPGAIAVFQELKKQGILVVLNTGYNTFTAKTLLVKLNWEIGADIDLLVTASDVVNGRPAPDMIHLAMQYFKITDPGAVVKVGDSSIDIEEGKNAHCGLVAGITTGAHTAEQLLQANPDIVIGSLAELSSILIE